MDLPTAPHKKLTSKQQEAFETMLALLRNIPEADRRYNNLKLSKAGRVISTDIARYLDPNYAKQPRPGQSRDLEPSWDLAWRYAQNRLSRELENRGGRKRVRFMAGGWGAGKTFALRNEPSVSPCLIWDGTLSELTWGVEMVDLALKHHWQVEIAYVYRDMELALYGAIQRKREVGRGVPLMDLPKNHRSVQQTVLSLTELYRGNPSVSFLYLHNLGIPGVSAGTPEVGLIDLEANGALHYLPRHERYYTQAAESLDGSVGS